MSYSVSTNPGGYGGIKSPNAPTIWFVPRDPTVNDWQNYALMDEWCNIAQGVVRWFKLLSLENNQANWVKQESTDTLSGLLVQTGTSPVVPNATTGYITINGILVAAGTNPVRTDGTGTNTLAIEVQTAQAIVSTDASNVGLAAFNSAQFDVDANGFVTITAAPSSISITGDTGGAQTGASFTFTAAGIGLSFDGTTNTFTLNGVLDLTNGGTNANLTASNGGIFYSTATAGAILSGTATANQALLSGSSSAPAWSTATYPPTTTINQIIYSSAANTIGGITAADNGVLISGTTGIPSWLANSGTPGYVLTANTGAPPSWQSITAEGAVTTIDGDSGSVAPVAGVITISGGTTGLTTSGSGATLDLTGTLSVSSGGTAATTFNTNGVVISNTTATGALAALTLTAGQIVIGSATTPGAANLTPGPGISITNGNNSITVSTSGGGFTWNDVTGGSATLAAQNGYLADSAGLTTFTMPTNNAIGDTIKIVGNNTGGWEIIYGAGQYIIYGASTTTTTTGNLSSSNGNDCVELICTTASVTAPIFSVVNSIGNIGVN